jgi:structural maintenance of chromosome 3 (chondroitin sulfate proteoglycan 6)
LVDLIDKNHFSQGATSGADGLQRLLRQFADENRNPEIVKGYHGTLIENIECDPAFYTAVEVIAGNRYVQLFYSILLFLNSLI